MSTNQTFDFAVLNLIGGSRVDVKAKDIVDASAGIVELMIDRNKK